MLPKMIDINSIKPAPYNPRKIKQKQFENLQKSLLELGCVIPVLVNSQNHIIIAGHQRSKALKAIGAKEVPCFFVDNVSKYDEARFNQFHNGIDMSNDSEGKAPVLDQGWKELEAKEFTVSKPNASRVKAICRLLNKYGNVLSCVISGGEIVYGGNYVKACQLLKLVVNTYSLQKNDKALDLLHDDYGEFSYDNFKRETYVQGLAQMNRLRGKKQFKSNLYEKLVIPYLKTNNIKDFLDFGAGRAAYCKLLGGTPLEFFQHKGDTLLVSNGNKMVDRLINEIKQQGRYSLVVCDSVINSTDSMEAEMNVLRCLNIFAKSDVMLSGRLLDVIKGAFNRGKDTANKNWDYFIDDQGFSASYRKGHWYYQHFHTKESFIDEIHNAGFELVKYNTTGASFQAHIKKSRELTIEEAKKAIDFEFNLPLPNGKTYQRHNDVWEVIKDWY